MTCLRSREGPDSKRPSSGGTACPGGRRSGVPSRHLASISQEAQQITEGKAQVFPHPSLPMWGILYQGCDRPGSLGTYASSQAGACRLALMTAPHSWGGRRGEQARWSASADLRNLLEIDSWVHLTWADFPRKLTGIYIFNVLS